MSPRGLGVWTLEDNTALGCEEMMHTDSGYSRADRLEETLIDPENRDACGRNVTEPGADVEQSSRNVVVVGRPPRRNYRFIQHRCFLGTLLGPVLPVRVQTSGGAAGFSAHWGENASIC